MTNAELIRAIRNEIERLKTVQLKRIQEGDLVDAEPYDKNEAYNELLSFLDTLESEKPEPFFYCKYGGIMPKCSDCKRNHSNSKYKTEDIENWFSPSERGTKQCSEYIPLQKSEKPMNQDGLEKEIDRVWKQCNPIDEGMGVESTYMHIEAFNIIARHFAQFGAEHLANSNDEVVINGHKVEYDKDKDAITMEEIPNDLEEAAENYSKERAEGHILYDWVHAFKAGAKWQADHTPLPEDTVLFNKGVEEGKRLMMEEAVEYEVWDFSVEAYPHVNIPLDNKQYRSGDKIRVIVLPKED